MNWKSKIALLIAALCLVAAVALQFMTGMWLNLNSLLLAGAVGGVAAAAVLDWKLYFDFFTMRTTKHGMNMGLLILLTFTGLICVNYLANKHNKSWDVTKERLNSLSEQSVTLLKGLKDDVRVTVFYKGPAGNEERQKIQQSVITYQDQTPHLKAVYHNAYVDSAEAIKYLTDQPDRETAPVFMFLEHGAKKARVDAPFDEAQITSGLIKVTRQAQAKIYFVQGHGEKDLEGADDQSLKDFGAALGEASFVVQSLNLLETKTLPKDGVIAIVGPQVPYLDGEIQMLREFARGGGRLFLALDPGVRHNLANLTKTFGVEFTNNYVLTRMPIQGGGPATVLGRTFDAGSDITRSFPAGSSFTAFPLAAELKTAPDKAASLTVRDLVKTDNMCFTVTDPTKPITRIPPTAPVTVALEVTGREEGGADFAMVIFGDSDFLSNRGIMLGMNRDLALNALAFLSDQKDLISIKPKLPEGTMMVLTRPKQLAVVFGALAVPLVLLISGGILWFKRRGA